MRARIPFLEGFVHCFDGFVHCFDGFDGFGGKRSSWEGGLGQVVWDMYGCLMCGPLCG